MPSSMDSPPLSTGRKVLFGATYLLVLLVIFIAAAEIILRAKGLTPEQSHRIEIRIHPGGRLIARHPSLGFTHVPGSHTIELPTGLRFRMTILPNGLRITRPLESYAVADNREKIWIFGCSYTEGWSLNDDETYAWLIQQRYPQYEVVNFGVGGYGTVHSLLQFREALKTATPKVVVLAYADFHDERNTLSRSHREAIRADSELGPLQHPYAWLDEHDGLQIGYTSAEYFAFPLERQSALAEFLDDQIGIIDTRIRRSDVVSKELIGQMGQLAKSHGVELILANIDRGPAGRRMLRQARTAGIQAVDISVNRQDPRNTNLPHDAHPSALANRKYADRLDKLLRARLANRP